jgi:hypothetical protein
MITFSIPVRVMSAYTANLQCTFDEVRSSKQVICIRFVIKLWFKMYVFFQFIFIFNLCFSKCDTSCILFLSAQRCYLCRNIPFSNHSTINRISALRLQNKLLYVLRYFLPRSSCTYIRHDFPSIQHISKQKSKRIIRRFMSVAHFETRARTDLRKTAFLGDYVIMNYRI